MFYIYDGAGKLNSHLGKEEKQKTERRFPDFFAGVFRFWLMMMLSGLLAASAKAAEMQRLHGHLPSAVAGMQPIGDLPQTNQLNLVLALPLRNQLALADLLREIYDPASPNYRHYLTPEQFADSFGPTELEAQAVAAFALTNGLIITATHPNRMLMDVTGSVADIERAFHLRMRRYRHPQEARFFYAPDAEPSLELKVPIAHISGLDNYALPRPRLQISPASTGKNALPNAGSGPYTGYLGKDFRAAYVPDSSLTGSGQVVGLLQFDGYTATDISYYENLAQLPNVTLTNVLLDGFDGFPTGSGGEVEVSLDIEMAISMAPGLAKVVVYEAGPFGNWHDILNRMATDNLAKQISCSWYIPGGLADPVADQIFQQMAAQGQSFYAASGDQDAYTGLIPFPGDTPYITQVGGTTLTTGSPGGPRGSETAWNRGNGIGSGGGISTQYPIPSWQTNISMTANLGSTTKRNTPDVALTADNVYVRADGRDYSVGGTSCSAPLWAGFTALVNQEAVASGRLTVGFINPAVDAIGTGPKYSACFHDIISGNNQRPGSSTKFPATSGYDLCTGWGTPVGQALIDALANPEPLLITPPAGFVSLGGVGGPFTITRQDLTLTNTGTNSLTWTLTNVPSWLDASSTTGVLATNGPATIVTLSLNAAASNLVVGTYSAAIWFTNLNDHFGQSRNYTLSIISPPAITTQPTNLAVIDGAPASFSAGVVGGVPLSYQWQFNGTDLTDGTNLSGSTSNILTIFSASGSNVGSYSLIVSNAARTITSSNALLAITPSAPVITVQPTNEFVVVNRQTLFVVAALGDKPFSYQWSFNNTNIPDATNATLILNNVQFTQAGNYAVTISNDIGPTLSSNAVLTVLAAPPCAPPGAGIVSWWRAENNAYDAEGINSGILDGTVGFASGEVNEAFWLNSSNADVHFPASPTLDVGVGSGFTVEAWIYPSNVLALGPIFEWNNRAGKWGVHLYTGPFATGGAPALYANIVDTQGSWHRLISAAGAVTSNVLQHVALTYDQGSGLATLYLNGTPLVQQSVGTFTPQTSYDLYLGRRVSSGAPSDLYTFAGLIDEAALYNRALSTSEIQAIYNAGVSGKCFVPTPPIISAQPASKTVAVGSTTTFTVTATGSPPLQYQWIFNATNLITGATNASVVLTNIQYSEAGNYAVLVTNGLDSALSSNAVLTVLAEPPCDPVPTGIVSWWPAEGSPADAAGTNPISPQGGLTYTMGEVGQAFKFDGFSAYLSSPATATLNIGTGSGLTIEAWINPDDISHQRPLVEWNSGPANGANFGAHFWLSAGGVGALYANLLDTGGGYHVLQSADNIVNTNSFQHVAVTYDKATGLGFIYYNGAVVATGNLGSFTPQTTYPFYLGDRPIPNPTAAFFSGLMDEASIYNRALSAAEIQVIVDAGVSGKCRTPTPPAIVSQPTDEIAVIGSTTTFSVIVSGSPPLQYQWIFNATNLIAGATNASLILTNVQFSQAGDYAVRVTNQLDSAMSSNALLTVIAAPTCDPVPFNLVSWWPAEGTPGDAAGTNPVVPQGNLTYAVGEVGQAFAFDGTSAFLSSPASTTLNLGAAVGLTIETWIKPNDVSNQRPLVEWNTGPAAGAVYGAHFWLSAGGAGALFANLIDTTGAYHILQSADNIVNTGGFQHVAVTYDKASGLGYLYYNGIVVATANFGTFTPQTGYNFYLGCRPAPSLTAAFFSGLMDETSIYGRALSGSEIQAIYNAGVSGKCFAPTPPTITSQPANESAQPGSTATFTVAAIGSQPLTYQWVFNQTHLISGATNASLVLTNVQLTNQGLYTVALANSFGFARSHFAMLTVTAPTLCDPPLPGLAGWWPAEGSPADAAGTNSITPQGGLTYAGGEVGQAFKFDGASAFLSSPATSALNVGTGSGMTIEAWIKPNDIFNQRPLVEWNTGPANGANFGAHFWLSAGGVGALFANLLDTGGSYHILQSANNIVNTNGFQHVAVTYDKASGIGTLYYNGSAIIIASLGSFTPQTSYPFYLGGRPAPSPTAGFFSGLMDEASVYNRALSSAEIHAIYSAGSYGKCPPVPVITVAPVSQLAMLGCDVTFNVSAASKTPLGYQWFKNNSVLNGQTNASLFLGGIQSSNFGTYEVLVTNIFGAVLSTPALLALDHAPIAGPDVIHRFASGGVKVPVSDLLTNDTDEDGDLLSIIGVSSNSAANGTVSLQGKWIYYTPPAGFTNADSYTYTVWDGYCGGTNFGAVTVQVQSDNFVSGAFAVPQRTNSSVMLSFDGGIPTNLYRLQFSDSLINPNWQDLSTQAADTYGSIQFVDHPPTNSSARYYRSVKP